jgi:hypothetical protein
MDEYEQGLDDTFNRYESMKGQNVNNFESPESIARHILEHEPRESGAVNADSSRANLNPNEMRTARSIGSFIAEMEYAERICGWDLHEAKENMKDQLSTTNVPSRSKDGFAIVLSKTDRRVQSAELNQFAGEVANHFNEETEEGLLSKIPLLGGLVKKKDGAVNG